MENNKLINNFLELTSRPSIRMSLFFGLAFNCSNWILAYYIAASISSELIVLHYNINFGIDWVDTVDRIYFFPLLGLAIWFFNLFLAFLIGIKERFLIHVLCIVSLIMNVLLLISLSSLYLINF